MEGITFSSTELDDARGVFLHVHTLPLPFFIFVVFFLFSLLPCRYLDIQI